MAYLGASTSNSGGAVHSAANLISCSEISKPARCVKSSGREEMSVSRGVLGSYFSREGWERHERRAPSPHPMSSSWIEAVLHSRDDRFTADVQLTPSLRRRCRFRERLTDLIEYRRSWLRTQPLRSAARGGLKNARVHSISFPEQILVSTESTMIHEHKRGDVWQVVDIEGGFYIRLRLEVAPPHFHFEPSTSIYPTQRHP